MAKRERESETGDTAFAVQKRKTQWKRQGQGNTWHQVGPCPPPEVSSKHVQSAQPYQLQQANRGEGKWSEWAREVRQSQPEYWDHGSNKRRASAGDARAWKCKDYESSEWDGSKWSTPTAKDLSGSDYDTDRDRHARTMRYGDGWVHHPTYSQQKRAKPTHMKPEYDMKVDPSMPIGSTSKTYNPRTDGQFWPSPSGGGEEWTHSSASSSKWKPRLRTEKYFSSVPGDVSEASTALQHLGSIDESEGDAVRDWLARSSHRQ